MVTYYLDTSAAVKLYVSETESDWLCNLLAQTKKPMVLSSLLLRVEIRSAFARRLREGTVSASEYANMCYLFDEHRAAFYRLSALNETVVQLACSLIERHPLRAYDATHLATAVTLNTGLLKNKLSPLTFLSADTDLLKAASSEGLATDNPNQHP